MGEVAAPAIDDARRAGHALTEAVASELMVFRSVAEGETLPRATSTWWWSSTTWTTAYALEDLAADAVGQFVGPFAKTWD